MNALAEFEGRIATWSFNRLQDYTKCAYMALLKYGPPGKKVEEPPEKKDAPALVRGREHHDALEKYVKGEIERDDLPKALDKHLDTFDLPATRERYAADPSAFILEEEWAFDEEWVPTGWFADDVWGRAKLDLGEWLDEEHTALDVADYKSGKKFGNEVKHALQMQEYAAICFTRYATLQHVTVRLLYTDEGKKTTRSYTREQAMMFLTLFDRRAREMTKATQFRPKPSRINCAYCAFGPNNGGSGVCKYGVES